jgi:hypothetical protein
MALRGRWHRANLVPRDDSYREFKGWVKLILIRKATDVAAIGIDAKNEPKRFEDAFKDVPREVWHVFEDPDECHRIVERVVNPQPQPQ